MNGKQKIYNKIDLEKLLSEAVEMAKETRDNPESPLLNINSSGEASDAKVNKILLKLASELGVTDMTSLYSCIAILIQQGATAPSMPKDTKVVYNGVMVSAGVLRRICATEDVTVRQLARKLKSAIPSIMLSLGDLAPEGNLAKQMRLELKNVTREEAIWASDFQTYNEECPDRVRLWLVKDYKNKFNKNK